VSVNARTNRGDVRFGALGERALPLFLDQIRKLIEKVRCIMRAGRGFGMILHTEDRQFLVPHSFHGPVVQIYVRYFHI
jgi:hypothetical protein